MRNKRRNLSAEASQSIGKPQIDDVNWLCLSANSTEFWFFNWKPHLSYHVCVYVYACAFFNGWTDICKVINCQARSFSIEIKFLLIHPLICLVNFFSFVRFFPLFSLTALSLYSSRTLSVRVICAYMQLNVRRYVFFLFLSVCFTNGSIW